MWYKIKIRANFFVHHPPPPIPKSFPRPWIQLTDKNVDYFKVWKLDIMRCLLVSGNLTNVSLECHGQSRRYTPFTASASLITGSHYGQAKHRITRVRHFAMLSIGVGRHAKDTTTHFNFLVQTRPGHILHWPSSHAANAQLPDSLVVASS